MVLFLVSDVFPFATTLFVEAFYRMHRALWPGCNCQDDSPKQRLLQGGAAFVEFAVAIGMALFWKTLSLQDASIVLVLLVALQTYSGYFFSSILRLGSFYSGLYEHLFTMLGFHIGIDRVVLAVGLAALALTIRATSTFSGGSVLYLWATVIFSVCIGFLLGVLPTRR